MAGLRRFIGAGAALDDQPYTYRISVHALDVTRLDVSDHGTPTRLLSQLYRHAVGRASINVTGENPQLASRNAGELVTL